MADKIKGNHDGEKGGNKTYTIQGRGVVQRDTLVKEVKNGQHSNFTTTKINGVEYVKAKPNKKTDDNVNKGT